LQTFLQILGKDQGRNQQEQGENNKFGKYTHGGYLPSKPLPQNAALDEFHFLRNGPKIQSGEVLRATA
jgi:hypothetical protein